MTSRLHAVLFTKEGCAPCGRTKEALKKVLKTDYRLGSTISTMKKENHSALVESYNLTLYPTLLIVGPNGLEIERHVGGKKIESVLLQKLTHIYKENQL